MRLYLAPLVIILLVAASSACQLTMEPAAAAAHPGPADLLLARLAYVRADYPHAVQNGVVVDRHEAEEQVEIVEDALAAARGLPLSRPTRLALGALKVDIVRLAPAEEVTSDIDSLTTRLREELTFDLSHPDPSRLDDAPALYAEHCASCHGAAGEGPPPALAALRPAPSALADSSFAEGLSPRRVYAAVTFGVPDTAMVPRADALSDAERWALGFYVASMGLSGASAVSRPPSAGGWRPPATPPAAIGPDVNGNSPLPTRAPVVPRAESPAVPLETLASATNAELRAAHPSADLAHLRAAGTRAAAASPLLPLRTRVCAFALASNAEPAALAEAWTAVRAGVPAAAAADVDAALATFGAAPPEGRRAAAAALLTALSEAEAR